MGHISTGHGVSGTDLVEGITCLNTVVSHGCLARVPGKLSIWVMQPRLTFPEPQGAVPLGSNPPRRGYVYGLVAEGSLFRGLPTGPEAFLGTPGMSGLRPFAWTFKKASCHTRPFGGAYDKYRWLNKLINIRIDLTSFGCTAFWPSSISCKFSC